MVVVMYVTIPVKKETKELVDARRAEMGLETYDETIAALARPTLLEALAPFKGTLKGTPEFKRNKHDRKIV
jgi:hypothetical protein